MLYNPPNKGMFLRWATLEKLSIGMNSLVDEVGEKWPEGIFIPGVRLKTLPEDVFQDLRLAWNTQEGWHRLKTAKA